MTEQEIIENNILIARFMDYKVEMWQSNPPRPTGACIRTLSKELELMKFHESWSWLMPVVCKAYEVTNDDDRSFNYLSIFEYGLGASMEDIYSGVVEFVKWYNETKRNT